LPSGRLALSRMLLLCCYGDCAYLSPVRIVKQADGVAFRREQEFVRPFCKGVNVGEMCEPLSLVR